MNTILICFCQSKKPQQLAAAPVQSGTKTPFLLLLNIKATAEYAISLLPPPLSVTVQTAARVHTFLMLAFREDRMEGGFLILQLRDFVTSKGSISCELGKAVNE